MNILTGLAAVNKIVKDCIRVENAPNRVLEDVKSIITVANNEDGVDEPCIWIVQHPTIPVQNKKASISREMDLVTTFEFVCIEYDEDPEVAEMKSQNLASRSVLSVMKNFQQIQTIYGERVIKNIHFNRFYPVGEIPVAGKREKVPVTSVALDIVHHIDWMNCCKPTKKNEETDDFNDYNDDNEW